MDKNGEIPWSCLAPGGAWKAEIWYASDETAVLARRLAAASPAILAPSCHVEKVHASSVDVFVEEARCINKTNEVLILLR